MNNDIIYKERNIEVKIPSSKSISTRELNHHLHCYLERPKSANKITFPKQQPLSNDKHPQFVFREKSLKPKTKKLFNTVKSGSKLPRDKTASDRDSIYSGADSRAKLESYKRNTQKT